LTINAATVTGHTDGINAKNFGNGALSITATGTVTGTTGTGIYAYKQSQYDQRRDCDRRKWRCRQQ
jgi:hypothetical protein